MVSMSTRIPHLPDEIHLLVGQHVRRDDSANYRLASKRFLSVGTANLFRTLTFHCSTASLARLANISNSEQLRKHVEIVFLDVNLWRIPNVRDLNEWQTYFCRKAAFLRAWDGAPEAEEQACRLDVLAQDRKEWLAYLDKMDDEKQARRDPSFLNPLERFHNLHKIYMVHGQLVSTHQGFKKVSDEVDSASAEPISLRRGEGMNDIGNKTGNEAFESLLKITIPPLRKLKLDRIHYTNFASRPVSQFANLSNLTSLTIKITVRADRWNRFARVDHWGRPIWGPDTEWERGTGLSVLQLFLQELRHLECLKIDLESGNAKMEYSVRKPLATIENVFGTDWTWPRLRKLSLCHFYATPETLLSLLATHRKTLRDLRLRNIELTTEFGSVAVLDEYSWPQILQYIAGCLDLQRTTVSGQLATEKRNQVSWDLDANPEFAGAISDYLIHGGDCPW
ncbi:uncharacterized protein yc1106_08939 [Curvularia clavata]|uniref:F-box domain-containing protein n=1 Tax=Curvularia clavata TaxID=95742 RepID=A0A9Q8ZH80_CURCL|nr:uncharacterized protein yc1106_08939 [Curvularia clavata]